MIVDLESGYSSGFASGFGIQRHTYLGPTATPRILYGDLTGKVTVKATTITFYAIEGGENLTALSYVLFNEADLGAASIIKQGNDETTTGVGDMTIDITGLGVSPGAVLTCVISNYTDTPVATNRGAVCYGTAEL